MYSHTCVYKCSHVQLIDAFLLTHHSALAFAIMTKTKGIQLRLFSCLQYKAIQMWFVWMLLIIVAVVLLLIINMFLSVYNMAIDTILLWFNEQNDDTSLAHKKAKVAEAGKEMTASPHVTSAGQLSPRRNP